MATMHTPSTSRAQKQNKTKSTYELFKYSQFMHKYCFHAAWLEITLMKTQTTNPAPETDVLKQIGYRILEQKEE